MTNTIKKPILVAGSGRSGTTWLGNIIAGNERRILFEPFDCRRVPEFSDIGLRPYFAEKDEVPNLKATVTALLNGAITNEWIDQDKNRLDPLADNGALLIKEIRVNGMLAWLSRNFPCSVVYLVRDPFAVVASRMKLGWETHIESFTTQPRLMEDFLSPFTGTIEGARTVAQKHAVMWCIENLVPLRQLPKQSWIYCRYEKLVAHPEMEAGRLLELLGLEFTPSRLQALGELSRTSYQKTERSNETLSDNDCEGIAGILDAFGIDLNVG